MLDVWNLLHDGVVSEVRSYDGDLIQIVVEIEYLCEQFFPPATSMIIELAGCNKIEYKPYEGEGLVQELQIITAYRPQILQARESDFIITVACDSGLLVLKYQSMVIKLEGGKIISLSQLKNAAEKYWGEFERID